MNSLQLLREQKAALEEEIARAVKEANEKKMALEAQIEKQRIQEILIGRSSKNTDQVQPHHRRSHQHDTARGDQRRQSHWGCACQRNQLPQRDQNVLQQRCEVKCSFDQAQAVLAAEPLSIY